MTAKLLALLCVVVGSGCGLGATACPDLAAANFTVTVLDAATSQRICDATVTATETSTGTRCRKGAARFGPISARPRLKNR